MNNQDQIQPKKLTGKQIDAQVRNAPPRTQVEYDKWFKVMVTSLDSAMMGGQEELAGFMFAYAKLGDEICRRFNVKQ